MQKLKRQLQSEMHGKLDEAVEELREELKVEEEDEEAAGKKDGGENFGGGAEGNNDAERGIIESGGTGVSELEINSSREVDSIDFDAISDEEYAKWLAKSQLKMNAVDKWIFHEIKMSQMRLEMQTGKNSTGPAAFQSGNLEFDWHVKDLKDAVTIEAGTFQVESKWRAENSRMENGGKARCLKCDKLFLDGEYLVKHFGLKHGAESLARQVQIAEPFLLERVRLCPLDQLPFPQVMVETKNGDKLETMSTVVVNFAAFAQNSSEANIDADKREGAMSESTVDSHRQTNGKKRGREEDVDEDARIDREVKSGSYFDVDAPKVRHIATSACPPSHPHMFPQHPHMFPQASQSAGVSIAHHSLLLWNIDGSARCYAFC